MKDSSKRGMAKWVKPVCGWLLIVCGILLAIVKTMTFWLAPELLTHNIWIDIISYVVLIVGGAYVLLTKHGSANIVIGLTGLVIGAADLINQCPVVIDYIELNTLTGLIISAMLAAIPFMDVLLLIFSIRYMQGHRRNAIRMSICVLVPLALFALILLFVIAVSKQNFERILYFTGMVIPQLMLYGTFFVILLSPGIRENFSEIKVSKLGNEMYDTMITDPKSSIYRDDFIGLCNALEKPQDWKESETIPDCKEYGITFGRNMNIRRMTFRKMDGDDNIRVSIMREGEKTYIQATRFDYKGMLPHDGDINSCKLVRFFGEKGYYIDIAIRDDRPEPRKAHAIERATDRLMDALKKKKE